MESWLSGRKRLTANEVRCKNLQGFESLTLRRLELARDTMSGASFVYNQTVESIEKEKYKKLLSELEVPENGSWKIGFSSGFTKISITQSIPEAYLLNHILTEILDFPCDWMPMEKVAWETGFKCNGILCKVASHKFGYRLFVDSNDSKKVADIQEYFVKQSNQAIKYFKTHLKDYAKSEIQNGDITITNQYTHLKKMYEYFRKQSQIISNIKVKGGKNDDWASVWNKTMGTQHEIYYLNQAAYFAFFGLLEHLLVLLLAFTDFDPVSEPLDKAIFLAWSEKYKKVFDVNQNDIANQYYQMIHDVAKHHRNPHAHGMFGKDNRSMNFVLEGTGLVSAHLPDQVISHFPEWMKSDSDSLEPLDNFLKWLEGDSDLKVAMQIITGGLDIHFSKEDRNQYKLLMKEGDASEYVYAQNEMIDNYMNMDW